MRTTKLLIRGNSWPRDALRATVCICGLAICPQLLAQQAGYAPPPKSQAQSAPAQTQSATSPGQGNTTDNSNAAQKQTTPDPKVPQNDRILWTLPNYLTVENASSLPPLKAGQKFALVAKGNFDPLEFGFLGLVAGVNQASNTNPTFGQGLKGYGKRYALAFGDNTNENFMVGAVLPSLLHQDPRYYQLGKGSFLHRVVYAGLRVVLTRSDSEKTQFNFSEIFGAAAAAAASNAYHPAPRTLGSNVSIWWTQIGWDGVSYELKEFWPDVHHYLIRRSHKSANPPNG